jgi:hypothetical protein
MHSRPLITTSCLLLFASAVFTQSDRGTITGTVSDKSGAVISNAQIQAKQLETGALFPTTSTATGNYTLVQLPVGPYEVTDAVDGFKKFVRSGIAVEVAQTLRVDIPLEVGAASESVTVSAEGGLLKTESGDVSSNVQVGTLDTGDPARTHARRSGSGPAQRQASGPPAHCRTQCCRDPETPSCRRRQSRDRPHAPDRQNLRAPDSELTRFRKKQAPVPRATMVADASARTCFTDLDGDRTDTRASADVSR